MAGLEKIVTDELVAEIADRLTASGRKITHRMIYEEIGGGSMTTISGALRRWRERQRIKAGAPVARGVLPETVVEAMREAVERLWKAAQGETQKEIEQITQAVNARVAETVGERDGVLAELQATADELQTVQAKADSVEAELETARKERERVRVELATVAERAGQLQARLEEVGLRAAGLEAELARVHDDARAERERQAAATALVHDDLDATRRELAEIQEALTQLMSKAQAEQEQHNEASERVREDAKKAADMLTKAEVGRDQALAEAADAREDAARLQGEVEALKGGQAEFLKVLAASLAERLPEAKVPA